MAFLALERRIPDSILPYPEGLLDRAKYVLWHILSPGFLFVGQNVLRAVGLLHHEGRQNYVIGKLAPGVSLESFLAYVHGQGFGNHFFAWVDDDQVLSLRKLVSFEWQYHLRVFSDGEVRGHYEWTPEAHPRWHVKEIGMEERREDFLRFLGGWIVPVSAQP